MDQDMDLWPADLNKVMSLWAPKRGVETLD
jgi:hypothetical protein